MRLLTAAAPPCAPAFAVEKLRSRHVGVPSATFRACVRRLRWAIGVQLLDNDLPTCPFAYLPLLLHSSTPRLHLEAETAPLTMTASQDVSHSLRQLYLEDERPWLVGANFSAQLWSAAACCRFPPKSLLAVIQSLR